LTAAHDKILKSLTELWFDSFLLWQASPVCSCFSD